MSIQNLEQLISKLVKSGDKQTITLVSNLTSNLNGDRQTLELVSSLLNTIRDFKKGSTPQQSQHVQENVQDFSIPKDTKEHASKLLDALYESEKTKTKVNSAGTTLTKFRTESQSDFEMRSHADALL